MPNTPTLPAERFFALDVLRGFALIGVFLINFAYGDTNLVQPGAIKTSWDAVASWFLVNAVEDRFWPLFSLSFGIGFSLLLLRSRRRGEPFLAPYLRRLAALFVFGWVTFVVLQGIPILNRYAIGGLVLLLFVRASNRTVLNCAFLTLLLSVVDFPLINRYDQWQTQRNGPQATQEEEARNVQLSRAQEQFDSTAPYVPFVWHHTVGLGRWVTSLGFYISREVQIVALFLLGLYVGRRGILEQPEQHLKLLRTVAVAGLVMGLTSWGIYQHVKVWPQGSLATELLQRLDHTVFYLSWALCYGATVVLLTLRPAIRSRLMPLACTGRLALTNFLMQFVLGFVVLSRFGLGWSDRFGTASRFGWVLVIFALQVLFSAWWLRRFSFGPAEWLWRIVTYGSRKTTARPISPAIA
jgi:uncharacterized protein